MKCSKCQGEKSPYEFPVVKNQPLICFDCLGPHKCIQCGESKHALEFMVMGKICTPCKIAMNLRIPTEQMRRYHSLTIVDSASSAKR